MKGLGNPWSQCVGRVACREFTLHTLPSALTGNAECWSRTSKARPKKTPRFLPCSLGPQTTCQEDIKAALRAGLPECPTSTPLKDQHVTGPCPKRQDQPRWQPPTRSHSIRATRGKGSWIPDAQELYEIMFTVIFVCFLTFCIISRILLTTAVIPAFTEHTQLLQSKFFFKIALFFGGGTTILGL